MTVENSDSGDAGGGLASDRESARETAVTVELLAIGLTAIGLGATAFAGVLPGPIGAESGLGPVLVGVGVGVAGYGVEAVQRSTAMQGVTLGSAFLATAVLLGTGIWAPILFLWGLAFVVIGLASYGVTSLSHRGSKG